MMQAWLQWINYRVYLWVKWSRDWRRHARDPERTRSRP